ncbi:transforming growth factor-beta-induced protein ig-h3-like isoform X2 [Liolophura sinensis]|uniref:transforming growth factor-beta-induced protein ig-h3-like isoform X2 n=1 Tax=Liolophura sinensis TaxID=3198878 RepID=UPI003158BCBC
MVPIINGLVIYFTDAATFQSKYDASAKLKSTKLAVTRFKSTSWAFMDAIPLWLDMATILRFLGDYRFVGLLKDADVYTNLSMAGPFSVFAPNNMAFILLPLPEQKLLYNKTYAEMLGKYHVVDGLYRYVSFGNDLLVPTVLGPNLRFNIYRSGSLRTVNGKPLVYGEFEANNGIVHQMNDILMDIPTRTIKEIVGNSSTLTMLYQALNNSDMLKLLDGPGPFTLFAPTDAAFAKLPPGSVDSLLLNTTALTDFVQYHIVSSTYFHIGLEAGKLTALNGGYIEVEENVLTGLTINGANITSADVLATNGVIQELDGVLDPASSP